MSNNKVRNLNLDILRIFAALFVFLVHLRNYTEFNLDCVNGFYGVWIFYILSGYLIALSIDRSTSRGFKLKEYYLKRIIRIVPLYYFALTIMWLYDLLRMHFIDKVPFANMISANGNLGIRYLRYYGFLQMIVPTDSYYVWNNRNGLWTMSAFMVFYLIAPWILKIAHKFWSSFIVLIAFILIELRVTPILDQWFIDNPSYDPGDFAKLNVLCTMFIFWFGVTAYYAVKENKHIWYLVLIVFMYSFRIVQLTEFEIIFTALLIAIVIAKPVNVSDRVGNVISTASKCSFPFYLTHIVVFDAVTRCFSFIGGCPEALRTIITGFAALIGAYITWRIITPVEDYLTKKWIH